MNIYKQAEEINNQKDFVKFLNSLQKDLQENLSEWENDSLAKFLDALKGYCSDKDRIYSAVAYFHYRYKKIKAYSDGIDRIQKQTAKQVSYDVNGGYNGLSHRQEEYTRISNVYLLNQCK